MYTWNSKLLESCVNFYPEINLILTTVMSKYSKGMKDKRYFSIQAYYSNTRYNIFE